MNAAEFQITLARKSGEYRFEVYVLHQSGGLTAPRLVAMVQGEPAIVATARAARADGLVTASGLVAVVKIPDFLQDHVVIEEEEILFATGTEALGTQIHELFSRYMPAEGAVASTRDVLQRVATAVPDLWPEPGRTGLYL
jgi:hypothetical protein